MFALQYREYGDHDVLRLEDAPEPHAGPGQVRITVRATSVNPFDWKLRAGYLAGMVPVTFPAIPGTDASGIVDEVGEGVQGVAVGDEVFGLGSRTSAEFAVLDHAVHKPASASWAEAAAMGLAVETAARCLDVIGVAAGTTLLVDGGSGGVGSAAIQLAVARGATVVATASPANHEYLASLGAVPTTYGTGLGDRVAALAPQGIDAAIDAAGKGSVPDLIALTGDATRVVSIADFTAGQHGAHLSDGSAGRAYYSLANAAKMHSEGNFIVAIEQVYPLAEGGLAHLHSQGGHVRGKLVLAVS